MTPKGNFLPEGRDAMNMTLFGDISEERKNAAGVPCTHPDESQFMNRNLFTGKFDVVCGDCGTTLAEDFQ